MTKKRSIMLIALVLALLLPIATVVATVVSADDNLEQMPMVVPDPVHVSPSINDLMGAGEEPEDISVTAGAVYQEKAWYEYVMYSEHAVCSYRLNDDSRLLFYDPYTYTNSMIMDVQFDAATTEFSTASSYSISHTRSTTITSAVESTNTSTSATQTSGRDVTHSEVTNDGTTKTNYYHSICESTNGTKTEEDVYTYKEVNYDTSSFMWNLKEESETGLDFYVVTGVGVTEKITIGSSQNWTTDHNTDIVTDKVEHNTYYTDYSTNTDYTGYDEVEHNESSITEGWTELSARVTKTIGSSRSITDSWAETESTTVTKVYAATHFASDGVTPLPWAIVHYRVQMPMKCCLQVKYGGEWVTVSDVYCLLTTVQGTCRAWMENGQVYYEDWGSGEPVVATDFWSQFMTKDQLINAYQDKLYPLGGED